MPRPRLLCAAVAAAFLAALTLSAPAHALHGAPHVATNSTHIGETTRLLESVGAYDIPGTPASPGSVGSGAGWSEGAAQALLQPDPAPGTDELIDKLRGQAIRGESKLGLLPKLAKFGKFFMAPTVAGFVGWTAGEYLIGRIFSPADPPAGPVWNINAFWLGDVGDTIGRQCYVTSACDDQTEVAYTFSAASRLYATTNNQTDFYHCVGEGSHSSPAAMVGALPEGAQVVTTYAEAPTGAGACGSRSWQHFSVIDPIGPGEFGAWGSAEGPQVGSITSTPCTSLWLCPTSATIEQKIVDELDSGNYPDLSREIDHEAEPERFPAPGVTETENDHRCDRAPGPTYMNPDGNLSPQPFAFYYLSPFSIPHRPPGHASTEIFLHYGETNWGPAVDPNKPVWYLDDWPGWGYRHIKAKHGWSELDLTETVEALQTVPSPDPNGDNWNYVTSVTTPGQGGVACARLVAVDFEPGTDGSGNPDPRPRGIVTSFNFVVN